MDFRLERINAHNEWPKRSEFKAEKQFRERLELTGGTIPFKTIILEPGDDAAYQVCVGHIIDGLEGLPLRPDHMFDHCFRVIDEGGRAFFSRKGIKGVTQGLGSNLLKASQSDWHDVINALCEHIPLMTCRYIAKRICVAHLSSDEFSKLIAGRTRECLGSDFYDELADKFGGDGHGNRSISLSNENINKAASFLKLYLSGTVGTQKRKVTHSRLDLTRIENLATDKQRIEFILSILLFTMRNERAHGEVLSPFRTSKASLERYGSYYFAMLASYIFALGVMQLRGFGGLEGARIRVCCEQNVTLQGAFFQ